MPYPSARKPVSMCSESTSALGQPRLTKPTRGVRRPGRETREDDLDRDADME